MASLTSATFFLRFQALQKSCKPSVWELILLAYGLAILYEGCYGSQILNLLVEAENVPTWSWASIVGQVSWEWFAVGAYNEFLKSLVIHPRVLEADCVRSARILPEGFCGEKSGLKGLSPTPCYIIPAWRTRIPSASSVIFSVVRRSANCVSMCLSILEKSAWLQEKPCIVCICFLAPGGTRVWCCELPELLRSRISASG